MGVGLEEPLPDTPPLVSDGLADELAESVGELDPVGVPEEDTVGVPESDTVGVGEDEVLAVAVGDPVPVPVGVAVGLWLVTVGLGELDGVADGQVGAAVAE